MKLKGTHLLVGLVVVGGAYYLYKKRKAAARPAGA